MLFIIELLLRGLGLLPEGGLRIRGLGVQGFEKSKARREQFKDFNCFTLTWKWRGGPL